jgi:nicotinate-nucleotide adenylyltransferase
MAARLTLQVPCPLKIAIFGGTFDPIHSAHLTVAHEALTRFSLDRILFVPAARPPHKNLPSITPYEHRYRMVELACAANPAFVPSRLEAHRRHSYSIHTIKQVRRDLALHDDLFFLIGADAFHEINTWHRADDVMRLVRFIVVTRPGHSYRIPPGVQVDKLETLALPVSSSDIRERLRAGEAVEELPAAVLDYIRAHGLYTG